MLSRKSTLMVSAAALGLLCGNPALAQSTASATTGGSLESIAPQVEQDAAEDGAPDILVTGSRIRRPGVETSAPVVGIDQQALIDRGYTSAADALNDLTSAVPNLAQANGSGGSSGNGQQAPNLFGLGTGRTLTLVNGRRFVTTSNGTGSSSVDSNVIPVGLLKRVEVVQAGGAAVYGSDAVAGVVNYILDDSFTGLKLDAQAGVSSRGDYATYSLRGVFGTDFAGGRGNVAAQAEWATSPTLGFADRPLSNLGRLLRANPANGNDTDGIPSQIEYFGARFYPFNENGVIFAAGPPTPASIVRSNGSYLQFSPSGDVVPYDLGQFVAVPFASGGQGFPYTSLVGLRTGVERISGNVIAHYDLTDDIKISTELLYARTRGTEIPQGASRSVLNSAATGAGAIAFNRTNPFLTAQAIATLSAASPVFASGGNLSLSKYFLDIYPSNDAVTTTDTYRGVLALDGKFGIGTREFYWSLAGTYGQVEGSTSSFGIVNTRFANAINAVRNGAGQIVCGVNADAITTNDDLACAPLNPFGNGNVSAAARAYLSTPVGSSYVNKQTDLLATLGGSAFTLPAGDLRFSVAYEHRREQADFLPFEANRLGLVGSGSLTVPQSGKYHTNEFSGEVLLPIVGGGFTLPLVRELEATGAYRTVDNSLAGSENVWNLGGRWTVVPGLTLRGSRSRNFRAPSLSQLLAPSNAALQGGFIDPCDTRNITSGPNPAIRRQNCEALFAANPAYGPLATFTNPAQNFASAIVTTGGNPNLRNEISKTWSYGFVFQPRFIRGLVITADRVEINLRDGLSAFTPSDFAATCYDTQPQPTDICSTFTRQAALDPATGRPAGTFATGQSTTFNAGITRYKGELANVNYRFPVSSLFGGGDLGTLDLNVEVTHTSLLTTSVTGTTFTRTDGTVAMPEWSGRFDLRYLRGPFRFSYQLAYVNSALLVPNATIENNPNPVVEGNTTHAVSAQYTVDGFTFRGGVTNLTDKMPSYPSIGYGDILGRRFYVGASVQF